MVWALLVAFPALYGWLGPLLPLPPSHPPTPPSTVLKLMHTFKNHPEQPEIQPSAIYKVSYMKANRLLSLLLIIKASKLQAVVCFN